MPNEAAIKAKTIISHTKKKKKKVPVIIDDDEASKEGVVNTSLLSHPVHRTNSLLQTSLDVLLRL